MKLPRISQLDLRSDAAKESSKKAAWDRALDRFWNWPEPPACSR